MKKTFTTFQKAILIIVMAFMQVSLAAGNNNTSLEEASEQIRTSTQGKILSAKTIGNNNQKTHRIQVLTPSGRVKIYNVPATQNNRKGDDSHYNSPHQRDRNNTQNEHRNTRSASRSHSNRHNSSRSNSSRRSSNSRHNSSSHRNSSHSNNAERTSQQTNRGKEQQ